jgi:aryl-alcohol dehydrogenase-like predicted oxidoreductase
MHTLLHRAHELGITHFDTSQGYMDSELILGRALKSLPRDSYTVSTKAAFAGPERVMTAEQVRQTVELSLKRLQLDYLDLMLIAGTTREYIDVVMNEHVPVLQKLKAVGKIRFIGSSEKSFSDGSHEWLKRFLPTDIADVAMVAHNMINQSAQRTVFPICKERNIGVMNIFTVRNLYWNPQRLEEVIGDLKNRGVIDGDALPDTKPMDWLLEDGEVESLVEAAYRYAAYTEPVTTVMCGTIDIPELEEDIKFVEKGPLSQGKIDRLNKLFGHIDEPIGN